MSPTVEKLGLLIIGGIIGVLMKAFYDWKIQPAISKSHKRAERREREAEERCKREKQDKLNQLNAAWEKDRSALRLI
jgi:hypothetical protein